jgi:hypothetical protein
LLDCDVCTAAGDVFVLRRIRRDISVFEFLAITLVDLFCSTSVSQFGFSLLALPYSSKAYSATTSSFPGDCFWSGSRGSQHVEERLVNEVKLSSSRAPADITHRPPVSSNESHGKIG